MDMLVLCPGGRVQRGRLAQRRHKHLRHFTTRGLSTTAATQQTWHGRPMFTVSPF